MMRRQRGVTMIGWIFLLVPVGLVLYAGLRAGPEYFDYYKVVTAMKETATKLRSDPALSQQSIRNALEKQFDTGYVDNPKISEIEIKRGENGWEMTADYERTPKLFGNLFLLLAFKRTVVIGQDAAAN